jgi:hypothetical protein
MFAFLVICVTVFMQILKPFLTLTCLHKTNKNFNETNSFNYRGFKTNR